MAGGNKRRVRRLVLRYYADRYLILLLICFAFTIAVTRLFLDITGYPQIGGGDLHLAHVLWGGLIWFAGSLLPLLFANKRAFDLSAVLIGVGSGLFMDEVGKFITASNNYFYPAAAPIIYAFFLLTILIYQIIRKESPLTARERLYRVIEQFEELIDGDLSQIERDRLLFELDQVKSSETNQNLQDLADGLLNIMQREENRLVPQRTDLLDRVSGIWDRWMQTLFSSNANPTWLLVAWLVMGLISIIHPLVSYYVFTDRINLPWFLNELLQISLSSSGGVGFLESIRLLGEGILGVSFLAAFALGITGRLKIASQLAYLSGLILLVLINLLVFYYDQFSAIIFTLLQLVVFLLTGQYRRFLSTHLI